jgi:hypothetical protein
MINEEQAAQRRAARQHTPRNTASGGGAQSGSDGNMDSSDDTGDYSTGGGMGGSSVRTGDMEMPENTAKFPPPADIPSGNNDDVFARQLREAAMRETDPEFREKLWDEYRKYKGISD